MAEPTANNESANGIWTSENIPDASDNTVSQNIEQTTSNQTESNISECNHPLTLQEAFPFPEHRYWLSKAQNS